MKLCVILICLMLAGCYKTEAVNLEEPAVVSDVIYSPAQHGVGTGVGMSTSGNMVVTTTNISTNAIYGIVFECEHGKFVVEGSRDKHKALWQQLKRGQKVIVKYTEIYRVDDKGGRFMLSRKFQSASVASQ